ncbi:MAG: mechanosensitive ion channel family protein [Gemmatimonadota bacterium]|nr:mechanosensitive ion channel family protein [Gemmatimonadota bacterium]
MSIGDFFRALFARYQLDGWVVGERLLHLLAIWVLAWLGMLLVGRVARRIERLADDGDDAVVTLREKRGRTLSTLLRNAGRVVIAVMALLLSLNLFIDITALLAGAGIVGLAISFGAQSLVKDVLSGFFMLLEDQFAVGDVVEIAGKGGVVERVTLRVVVLRALDGAVHIVPNGEITTVTNKTRGWSRAVLDMSVGYQEDVDRVIAIVRDEAEQFARAPEWRHQLDGEPPVEVWGIESLADNAVVIRMVARTQPGSHWNVARELRRRLKIRFDREGIEIPFPQRVMHLRADDPRTAAALVGAKD